MRKRLVLELKEHSLNKSAVESSKKLRIKRCNPNAATKNEDCTLTNEQISQIYQAKCEDLKVGRIPKQEERFREHCYKQCTGERVILREVLCQNTG